jgi:hypothetical protein
MPLIDLRTNLKSLKYGHDRPGGGDSDQPYIQTDINKASSGIPFDDGLIRDGAVGATKSSITDTLRISKFFTDLPKGLLFITKQVGLQLSNPRLEIPRNPTNIAVGGLDNILAFGTNGLLSPTRIYNLGINTIAQIPVTAFGGHFNRHGILPVQDKDSKYEAVVTANNNLGENSALFNMASQAIFGVNPNFQINSEYQSINNRLFRLTKELGIYGKKGKIPKPYVNNVGINIGGGQVRGTFPNTSNSNSSNLQGVTVVSNNAKGPDIGIGERISSLSYLGGPNSTYGIGSTDIKRSIITNFNSNKQLFGDITIKAVDSLTRLEDQNIVNDQYLTSAATGVSRIDSRLYPYIDKNDPNYAPDNAASIRDNTVIKYTDIQPRLRKYYELTDTLDKIPSQSELNNIIDTDKLHSSNVTNNTLSSTGVTTLRNVSSTGGNTTILKNDITYFNGIIDNTGTYQKVILKGFKSWNDIAREKRTGDFGESNAIIVNFSSGSKSINSKPVLRADSINLTPIFSEGKYWGEDTYPSQKYGNFNIRDLVKFRIQSVKNDKPDLSNFMIFRALLTNLTDNVDAKWTDINYVGRGNPFYIYNGFSRKIQIGFKVAALSAEEMMPMYSKLNYLMSTLMPEYVNNAMQGNLHRMTIGNYLDGQLGIIDSLSYTVSNDSPWEIALDEPEGGVAQLILPHIIEVSLGFTPIGADTKIENKIEAKSLDTSFIAQNNTGNDIDKIQYYNDFFNPL